MQKHEGEIEMKYEMKYDEELGCYRQEYVSGELNDLKIKLGKLARQIKVIIKGLKSTEVFKENERASNTNSN